MATCALVRDAAGAVVDWRWLGANPALAALTGLPDLEGRLASGSVQALLQSRPDLIAVGDRVASLARVESLEVEMPDGRAMGVTVFPAGEADTLGVIVSDVSNDRRARQALAAGEARYRAVVDSLAEGVVVQDATGRIVSWNPAALRILGVTEGQISGSTSYDPRWGAIWPDGRAAPGDEHPATRVRTSGEPVHGVVMGIRHVNGDVRWTELDADPLRGPDGALAGVVISFADVTDRRVAEARLAVAEDQRARTQALARIGAWTFDVATGEVAWSDETYRIHDLVPGSASVAAVDAAFDFYAPGDRETLGAAFDAALRDGTPYDLELDLRSASGTRKRVRTTGQAEVVDGRVASLFGHIQDITTQYHTAEDARLAKERLERLVDSNIVGVAFARADGSFAAVNDYYLALVGATRADFEAGRVDWRRVTPPEWLPRDEIAIAELGVRGVCTPYEKEYLRPDGSRIPVFIADAMMPGPEGLIAAIVLDISDQKRAEREIQALNADLESRVVARTRALEDANRELESFSYSVSHDLRAPLRSIDAFGGILAAEHADHLDAEGLRILGVIRRNAQQMGVLIDDLLAFSRVARKELDRRSVDMQGLVRSVIGELAMAVPGCQDVIEVQALCAVPGDPVLLRQVWQNLLANAVKFSRPSASPRIVVRCEASPDGRERRFMVEDNGVGYDPAYADKLFQPFQRLHPASQFEGSGIGLAIVARIVARHGGHVWSSSAPGEGATFGFALPVEETT